MRRRVIVSGRVQDVGYRDATARRARARGIAGWVRNRPDGTVEAVFEGAPDAVADLVAWCREGPRLAAVSGVEAFDEPEEGLAGFEVRR
ncbi:MAG: acylphosphatase [Solirubrobacteraceae bacterium]|nr:acylphosphatase [Solirubrobacteraceae bacterium]